MDTYFSVAYDAGSELNDEQCDHIPGLATMCSGGRIFVGLGEGFMHIHQEIHGIADRRKRRSYYQLRNFDQVGLCARLKLSLGVQSINVLPRGDSIIVTWRFKIYHKARGCEQNVFVGFSENPARLHKVDSFFPIIKVELCRQKSVLTLFKICCSVL